MPTISDEDYWGHWAVKYFSGATLMLALWLAFWGARVGDTLHVWDEIALKQSQHR